MLLLGFVKTFPTQRGFDCSPQGFCLGAGEVNRANWSSRAAKYGEIRGPNGSAVAGPRCRRVEGSRPIALILAGASRLPRPAQRAFLTNHIDLTSEEGPYQRPLHPRNPISPRPEREPSRKLSTQPSHAIEHRLPVQSNTNPGSSP
jgi:hypothetical protein